MSAPEGTAILIEISDLEGLAWCLYRTDEAWRLGLPPSEFEPDAMIRLPADIAWRLFIKGISGDAAKNYAELAGEARLTEPFFETLAIMA